jgi:hypothetical protein
VPALTDRQATTWGRKVETRINKVKEYSDRRKCDGMKRTVKKAAK